MKKSISKFLSLLLVISSILSVTCIAYADDYIRNWKFVSFTNSEVGVYSVDPYQWSHDDEYDGPNVWYVTEPNSSALYRKDWISYKGKWYFTDEYGKMLTNSLLNISGKEYYIQNDGSLLVNGYCTLAVGSFGDKQEYYANQSGELAKIN